MKTSNQKFTYELIVASEDKNRALIETVIYVLFILSAVISIGQFALQPVVMPGHEATQVKTAVIAAQSV